MLFAAVPLIYAQVYRGNFKSLQIWGTAPPKKNGISFFESFKKWNAAKRFEKRKEGFGEKREKIS